MRILNFGSLNIDHVYHVHHFVRPGETLSADNLEYFCGGKGLNQSIALSKAGAEVYHAGKIGRDGLQLKATLEENKVNTHYLEQTDVVNGHALIQVNREGENSIIIYGGSNRTISEDYVDRVLSDFSEGDLVLLQNEISCISYIARKCSEMGIKVAFNPSPMEKDLLDKFPFHLVSILLINEIEGHELTGKNTLQEMLDALMERYPNTSVILTLGSRGVVYHDLNHTYYHGTYDVAVKDTTAAGDTFTGFFLACLARGANIPECLEKASAASSLAVSKRGASASIPTMDEVNRMLEELRYREFADGSSLSLSFE